MVPHRLALPVIALAVGTCARAPVPPPVTFVDSTAFGAIRSRAYGVLRGDPVAVIAEKTGDGYRIARYVRDAKAGSWRPDCLGPMIGGDELEALRRVPLAGGELVFILTSDATPDTLTQRFALVDIELGCAVIYRERLRLPVPGEMIAPGPVPGGVSVVRDGTGLRVIDRPRVLRLDGAEGEIGLLLGVRERLIDGSNHAVQSIARSPRFLLPRPVTARWRADPMADAPKTDTPKTDTPKTDAPKTDAPKTDAPKTEMPLDLPELSDGENRTSFAIRRDQAGTLVIESAAPVVLLEIRHGCRDQPVIPLQLRRGAATYTTGTTPAADSFVRAAGRGHRLADGSWRDLFALQQPARRLEFDVAAHDEPRCVRQVIGFGFGSGDASETARPPAAPAGDLPAATPAVPPAGV